MRRSLIVAFAVVATLLAVSAMPVSAQNAGAETGVRFSYELAIGILPAVLLVIADGYYLSAPIRNDLLRRGV